MDEITKAIILDRIFGSSSICGHCGKDDCGQEGNLVLPDTLKTEHVLKAINIDEYFFKEDY